MSPLAKRIPGTGWFRKQETGEVNIDLARRCFELGYETFTHVLKHTAESPKAVYFLLSIFFTG